MFRPMYTFVILDLAQKFSISLPELMYMSILTGFYQSQKSPVRLPNAGTSRKMNVSLRTISTIKANLINRKLVLSTKTGLVPSDIWLSTYHLFKSQIDGSKTVRNKAAMQFSHPREQNISQNVQKLRKNSAESATISKKNIIIKLITNLTNEKFDEDKIEKLLEEKGYNKIINTLKKLKKYNERKFSAAEIFANL